MVTSQHCSLCGSLNKRIKHNRNKNGGGEGGVGEGGE